MTVNSAIINGEVNRISGIRLDANTFSIGLRNRENITIHTFRLSMFPIKSERKGIDRYVFSGPRLAMYYDVADPREGAFVNHFIEEMEIKIEYLDGCALFNIKGMADLSKSSFDDYWYKGEKTGSWSFQLSFSHKFPSTDC